MVVKTTKDLSSRKIKRALLKSAPTMSLGEHMLSRNDRKRVLDAYYYLYYVSCDTSKTIQDHFDLEPGHWYCRRSSRAALLSSVKRLASSNLSDVMSDFKASLQALRHLSDNERSTFTPDRGESKHTLSARSGLTEYVQAYGVCTSGAVWNLIQPAFYLLWLTDDEIVFFQLNSMIQFIQRLTLRDVDWIEEENIEAYKQFEIELKQQDYDPDVVSELRAVIQQWFVDWDETVPSADHGYGATFEVQRSKGTAQKYAAMLATPTVEAALLCHRLDWRPMDAVAWPGIMSSYSAELSNWLQGKPCHHVSDLSGKVQLVPKGIDKKRVVSMEPTCNQFYQKQIGKLFDKHFLKHPEMRINLHEQDFNRQLSLLGSANHEYGTIDLSSASDSVTWTLVKEIFKDLPVLDLLEWSRTTKTTLPDGTVVVLEKFAPMGSAVCFPVECTVFSAIVQVAMRRKGVNRYYRIYGDDIVCHRDVFYEVENLLESLHFIPNREKSFSPELPFKESCGIEAYNGFDVSPVRLSRKWDAVQQISGSDIVPKKRGNKVSPQLDALYMLGNQLLAAGFLQTRKALIQRARDLYRGVVFSHNTEHGFLTLATNLYFGDCQQRYYQPLQRFEVRLRKTVSTIAKGDDLSRYSKLIEEYSTSKRTSLNCPEDRIECKSGAAITTVKWCWYPVDDLEDGPKSDSLTAIDDLSRRRSKDAVIGDEAIIYFI